MFSNLFNKSSFGLEISDGAIKFIELTPSGNNFKVGRYGEYEILPGVKPGGIKNFRQIDEFFLALKQKEQIKSAHISLPGREIGNKEHYLSFFKRSGIEVKSFESQAEAISRAIIKKDDLGTYMIVDFGKKHTLIFIVSAGMIVFTSVFNKGGEMLTEMIQKKLNISFEEAEKIKQRYGLEKSEVKKEIFTVLLNGVSILRDEIEKHFLHWHTNKNKKGINNPFIKKIILCGSESGLVGLSEYLSVGMRHKVEMANVWINILDTEKCIPEISFKQSLGFASALGVALKGF